MNRLLTLLGLLAALAAGAWYGSPYYTVWRLSQAVKAGDAQGVARAVDFPAVRENLKPRLRAYLEAEAQRKPGSWLDRLGLALASSLMGSAVDVVVTPETLTAMLRTAKPPRPTAPAELPPPDPGGTTDAAGLDPASGPRKPTDTRAVRMGYLAGDLDLFRATLASRAHPQRAVGLRLTRRGFLSWKVVDVELPPSAFRR